MNNGLESRIERLTEQLRPEPAELITVILLQLTPIEESAIVRNGFHRVGRYAVAAFLGGTEREQRTELKRLRASGEYDRDPFAWTPPAVSGDDGERKAIGEGSDCD